MIYLSLSACFCFDICVVGWSVLDFGICCSYLCALCFVLCALCFLRRAFGVSVELVPLACSFSSSSFVLKKGMATLRMGFVDFFSEKLDLFIIYRIIPIVFSY